MFLGVMLACRLTYGKLLKKAAKSLKKLEQNVGTKRNVVKFCNTFEKHIWTFYGHIMITQQNGALGPCLFKQPLLEVGTFAHF